MPLQNVTGLRNPEIAPRRRIAATLIEVLFASCLALLALGIAFGALRFGARGTARLTPQLSIHQASRLALVRFLREVQEGMEVVSPRPGMTLSYAVIRDKVSAVSWLYLVPEAGSPAGTMELWRCSSDPALAPSTRNVRLLTNVRRLTFTAPSEGALQVHLVLEEDAQQYSMLTTVRLRNLPAAEELW